LLIRARGPVDYPSLSAWSFMQRSRLLPVSQLRSLPIIELLHKRALVAAKAWASLYPKLGFIIHTRPINRDILKRGLVCVITHSLHFTQTKPRFKIPVIGDVMPSNRILVLNLG
jgi:hypothetical protein